MADDVLFFLDRFYGNISGRSRSGSMSESDSRPLSRNRSRTNSFSNSEGFKVEGMTSLPPPAPIEEASIVEKEPAVKNVTSRRIFRIDDIDEDDEQEEEDSNLDQLAVAEGLSNHNESKKDI